MERKLLVAEEMSEKEYRVGFWGRARRTEERVLEEEERQEFLDESGRVDSVKG